MDFKEIQELIKQVNRSNISELKIKDGDFEITLRSKDYIEAVKSPKGNITVTAAPPVATTAPAAAPAPAPAAAPPAAAPPAENANESKKAEKESKYITIKSPMIGTFYRAAGPDKEPFVKVGDTVSKGDVLCIIEAMKLFNEIESEYSGKIVKVLVEDSSPVEFDQPLFLLEPLS